MKVEGRPQERPGVADAEKHKSQKETFLLESVSHFPLQRLKRVLFNISTADHSEVIWHKS